MMNDRAVWMATTQGARPETTAGLQLSGDDRQCWRPASATTTCAPTKAIFRAQVQTVRECKLADEEAHTKKLHHPWHRKSRQVSRKRCRS